MIDLIVLTHLLICDEWQNMKVIDYLIFVIVCSLFMGSYILKCYLNTYYIEYNLGNMN